MRRFEGKVVLVTGGTQGVGEAAARLVADEGAAGVVVSGRDAGRGERVAAELTAAGSDGVFVPVDLAGSDSCRDLVAAVDERFARIDVLVNAAGSTLRGTILDTTADLWDDIMAVNARGPFLLMQGAIRIMLREGIHGSIVNVASVAAGGAVPTLLPYAASKAALIASSKNIAYAMAWHRIRVNVVSPGWSDTPGEDAIQRRFHTDGGDWLEEAESRQPFGRLIKVDELARAIAYLASDDSGLMTGAVLDFDQSVPGAGPQPVPTRQETPGTPDTG